MTEAVAVADSWAAPTNIIALSALILSVISLALPFFREWRAKQGMVPDVSCEILPSSDYQGWFEAYIRMTNRTLDEWHINSIRVLKPHGARAAVWEDIGTYDPETGSVEISMELLESLSSSAPIVVDRDLSAGDRAKSPSIHGMTIGSSPNTRFRLMLTVPENGLQRPLKIEICGQTRSPTPRKGRIRISRALPSS